MFLLKKKKKKKTELIKTHPIFCQQKTLLIKLTEIPSIFCFKSYLFYQFYNWAYSNSIHAYIFYKQN